MGERANQPSDDVRTQERQGQLLKPGDKYRIEKNPETGDPWLYGADGEVIAAWQDSHWYDDAGQVVDNQLPAGLKPDPDAAQAPSDTGPSSAKTGTYKPPTASSFNYDPSQGVASSDDWTLLETADGWEIKSSDGNFTAWWDKANPGWFRHDTAEPNPVNVDKELGGFKPDPSWWNPDIHQQAPTE